MNILFLIFNRPGPTSQVFERIRAARPEQLFIAADGPRPDRPDDARLCDETRRITTAIDWPCEVKTLFRSENLGCKKAVSSGISWFFEHVEEGIVLEDDCLPDPSFFPYCRELLERYRADERVMMISGYNPVTSHAPATASYMFSLYGAIWGWASWRRAWQKYTLDPAAWYDVENQRVVRNLIGSSWQWKIKKWSYDRVFSGQKDTWDYQWEYIRILNHGLSVMPSINLIENIGFGADSTHTAGRTGLKVPARSISLPLQCSSTITTDRSYDEKFIEAVFGRATFLQRLMRMLGFKR